MPPPRLLRPLRPYKPRWSSPPIRWASDGPRDGPKGQRDDPSQVSTDAKELSSRVPDGENCEPAPERGWMQTILKNATGVLRRTPSTATPASLKPPTFPENPQPIEPPTFETDHAQKDPIEHRPLQKGPNASTSEREAVGSRPSEHLTFMPMRSSEPIEAQEKQDDVHTVESAHKTLGIEAEQKDLHVRELDQTTEFHTVKEEPRKRSEAQAIHTQHDAPAVEPEVSKSHAGQHSAVATSCPVCNEKFPSIKEFRKHVLWSDRCGKQASPYKFRHTCLRCLLVFDKVDDARHHFSINPGCLRHMNQIKAGPGRKLPRISLQERQRTLFGAAQKRSNMVSLAIANAQRKLAAMSPAGMQTFSQDTSPVWDGPKLNKQHAKGPDHRLGSGQQHQNANTTTTVALSSATATVYRHQEDISNHFPAASSEADKVHSTPTDQSLTTPPPERASPPDANVLDSSSVESGAQIAPTQLSRQDPGSIASNSDSNTAMMLQLQRLAEQVRLLTQALLASQNTTASPNTELVRLTQALLDSQNAVESRPSPQPQNHEPNQSRTRTMETATRMDSSQRVPLEPATVFQSPNDEARLAQQAATSVRLLKSSKHYPTSQAKDRSKGGIAQHATPSPSPDSVPANLSVEQQGKQSLLEELFPEASSFVQPHYTKRNPYPKLELPSSTPLVRRVGLDPPVSVREELATGFQKRMESIAALQLLYCSTELTESDFRRIIPKGKHIQGWANDGEFTKVIPGRDPVSLERLPFYYLLFKSPGAALAYQKNAGRLHYLNQLHQPSSIASAIPPPPGFKEDGEDIHALMSSFALKPTGVPLSLNMIMQPYNPALRALFERGGYIPIVPSTSAQGKPLFKVLMHIEGYEPTPGDLWHILKQEGVERGIRWPFHNGLEGVHRLRDITNLRGKMQAVSANRPRAAYERHRSTEDDPTLSYLTLSEDEGEKAQQLNQIAMNRVYNRWVIDFEEEEAAQRFARVWNRKVLPINKNANRVTWRDTEERRMCNAEFLW